MELPRPDGGVLVDARHGLVEQSRRHAFIASLLRIRHVVFAVNKMDLVNWDERVFRAIENEFRSFAARLDIPDLTFIHQVAFGDIDAESLATAIRVLRTATERLENL